MRIKDTLELSFKQMKEKRVRTALTILMVVIGVASIVALTSQTAGASKNIQSTLAALGPTSIIISPTGDTVFTIADISNLETLPNVSNVTPIVTGETTLSINGNSTSASVVGISSAGLQSLLGSTTLYQGSLYQDNVAPLAVIGHSIAFSSSTNTNLQTVQIGQSVTVEASGSRGVSASKINVPIVGILQSHGTSIVPVDSAIIVSLPFGEVLLHKTSFNEILVKANSVKSVTSLSALITTIYGTNARVTNTQQLASTASSITGEITLLFTVIGGISLVVAAIGIMNVMFMAVSERTHEIGILKSIGFKNKNVLMIFLFQALIIGIIGGIVGLGAGVGTSYALSLVTTTHSTASPTTLTSASTSSFRTGGAAGAGGFAGGGSFAGATGARAIGTSTSSLTSLSNKPVFTPAIIAEALIIAVLISVAAGIYPAWRASKLEPIDALRIL